MFRKMYDASFSLKLVGLFWFFLNMIQSICMKVSSISRVNNDEICLNIHTGKRHQILNLYKNKNKNLFKLKSFSLFFF